MLDLHMRVTHIAPMTFKEWLENTGTRQEDVAAKLGIGQSQISRIANGGTASLDLAISIRDLTDGLVTVDALRKKSVA